MSNRGPLLLEATPAKTCAGLEPGEVDCIWFALVDSGGRESAANRSGLAPTEMLESLFRLLSTDKERPSSKSNFETVVVITQLRGAQFHFPTQPEES